MRRAAIGLKQYGYKCTILFCGVGSPMYDNLVIQEIEHSISALEFDEKIIFSQISDYSSTKMQKVVRFLDFKKAWHLKEETPDLQLPEPARAIPAAKIEKKISRWIKKPKTAKLLIKPVNFKNTVSSYLFRGLKHYSTKIQLKIKHIYIRANNAINRIFCSPYYVVPLNYKVNYLRFREIIKNHQINLIVLPEDVVGNITPVLIKAGHSLKVSSLVLPYTICNQTEAFQALKERNDLSIHTKPINKVIGILFRSWVMTDGQRAVLRLPAYHVLGHLITRSSPPDPWMMNSGYANVIAIENEQMFAYYRNSGIPASKMKITGACYDDNLATYYLDKENQRLKLYKQLNIQTNKPLFLIGGFPNQILGNPPGFDFKDAEDAVNFITECIDRFKNDYELLFRPHPNYMDLSDLFAKKNIIVTDIDTAQLVAVSDVYLAFASSTIRWAISCGVPTINYDMFYYDFSDFKQVNGVLNACTKDEFKNAVKQMSDPDQYKKLTTFLEVEKKQWGYLDGQSVARINNLVRSVC
ncbi:MAG: CDP-glycerol glycerophosphotransferase family protein, partial [Gammaproteobacteria bacterium]|nr:CDP-glycerol glycerophosphotransferase family protein [Gammaproteobacteria bacterium]